MTTKNYFPSSSNKMGSIAQSTIVMGPSEQFLFGFEAAQFVWNIIWKRDQLSHVEMNILDTIQLSGTEIIGWIFTSSDGTVKSKLQSRWNSRSVLERATGGGLKQEIMCNYFNSSTNKFVSITDGAFLKDFLQTAHTQPTVVVSFAHTTGSVTYVECVYEFPVTIVKSAPPKITNYTLIDGKAKGKVIVPSSQPSSAMNYDDFENHTIVTTKTLPGDRILCLNKGINGAMKEYMGALVRVVESRTKARVTKMSILVLLETLSQGEQIAELHRNDTSKVFDKRIWLHHCSELVYQKNTANKPASKPIGDNMSEQEASQFSTELTLSSSASRTAKLGLACNGDFCFYNSIESRRAGFDFLDEEQESIREESHKAIARHRNTAHDKTNVGDSTILEGDEAGEGELETTAEHTSPALNAAVNENQNALKSSQSKKSVHTAQLSAPLVKQMKVTLKSIVLAREDMAEIERLELAQLSHEMAEQGLKYKPRVSAVDDAASTTAHQQKLATIWPKALIRWWLHVGRSLTQNKGGVVGVPLSSGHKINKAVLSNNSTTNNSAAYESDSSVVDGVSAAHMQQYADIYRKTADSSIKHNSSSTSEEGVTSMQEIFNGSQEKHNNLGHLSWYYSNVRVCEHCYLVYRELDRKRALRLKELKKSQRSEQTENEEERGREIERRIFSQRQFVSRLATVKDVNKGAGNAQSQSQQLLQSKYGGGYNQSVSAMPSGVLLGGDSLAFDSVAGGTSGSTSYYDSVAAAYTQQKSRKDKQPLVGAPKGALPPLPWQLSDSTQRERYEKTSNTFAVRNILDKKSSRGIAAVEEEQGHPDDTEDSWNAATGLNYYNNSDGTQHKRAAQKVKMMGRIKSNGYGQASKKQQRSGKAFNVDRLLHPWQRDLQKLKQLNQRHNSGEDVFGSDDEEDGEDELQQEPPRQEAQQFRSNVRRDRSDGKLLQQSSSEKVLPNRNSRHNALPSLQLNSSTHSGAFDDSSLFLNQPSQIHTAGSVTMLNQNSLGSTFSLDDGFFAPQSSGSQHGSSGNNLRALSKPPLKPLSQPSLEQPGSPLKSSNAHFAVLKSMAAGREGNTNPAGGMFVNPELIAATVRTRGISEDSLGSDGSAEYTAKHGSPQRYISSADSNFGARPTTTSTSRGTGRESPLTPLADNRVGTANGSRGGSRKQLRSPVMAVPVESSPGRPMLHRQLTRTDSIAEIDLENDSDEDETDVVPTSRNHNFSIHSMYGSGGKSSTNVNSNNNSNGKQSPSSSNSHVGRPPVSAGKTQQQQSPTKKSVLNGSAGSIKRAAAAHDSDSGEDSDDGDDDEAIGWSPFVMSKE